MRNSPDPWVEDAADLDNSDQLFQSTNGILEKTPAIADFLRSDTKKRIIVAPKGYGKTFLLKCKRSLLQQNNDYLCLPEDSMVDVTISDAPSLSIPDLQRFADYSFWKQSWEASLMVTVIKNSLKYLPDSFPLELADFKSPLIRQLLSSPQPVAPFNALKRLITSLREFNQARSDFTTLEMYFRQLRRPVAVFIDTIDEYLEGYVNKGQDEEDYVYIHKNRDSRIWVVGQLGICRAIRELLRLNSRIKIFASLRKEAFNYLETYDNNAININSLVVSLQYTKDELLGIIEKNILHVKQENLVEPDDTSPIGRFVGSKNLRILNSITKRYEPFYDFVVRHTLQRPRDLMLVGGMINNISRQNRTPEVVRDTVYEGAADMVRLYLAEMRGFTDIPSRHLFALIHKNVLNGVDLERIREMYAKAVKEYHGEEYKTDPFTSLYRLGLLGIVRRTRELRDIQIFRQPHDIEGQAQMPSLPHERYYLIHPALDGIIKEAHTDYIPSFHTINLIGHGYRWENGKVFKCAIKGDLKRSSMLMNDPIGAQFFKYLRQEFEICKRSVEYATLEGGDSIVFVDDSADRVVNAARCMELAVRKFEKPQSFRFGAAVGAVSFANSAMGAAGQISRHPDVALVLRTADRIEPYALPGSIICTEDFLFEIDESIRQKFFPVNGSPSGETGFSIKPDGTAIIRKNEADEPVTSKLFMFDLSCKDKPPLRTKN